MYDAIVIGARCGGASTAMLLARNGCKVLLVDRAPFPSDIPHGHVIRNEGPRLLKKWGLLDAVVRSNCPPLTRQVLDFGDFPLVATNLEMDSVAYAYARHGARSSITSLWKRPLPQGPSSGSATLWRASLGMDSKSAASPGETPGLVVAPKNAGRSSSAPTDGIPGSHTGFRRRSMRPTRP